MIKSKREFFEYWKLEREKGLKSYLINQTRIFFFKISKVSVFLVLVLELVAFLYFGWVFKIFLNTIIAFAVFIVVIPIIAIPGIFATWKENEKNYQRFLETDNHTEQKNCDDFEGMKKYSEYNWLKTVSVMFFLLAFLLPLIMLVALIIPFKYSTYIILIPIVLFFIVFIYLKSYFVCPICRHHIFSTSEDKRHPDVEGNIVDNLWSIVRNDEFTCFECGNKYSCILSEGKRILIKKEQ